MGWERFWSRIKLGLRKTGEVWKKGVQVVGVICLIVFVIWLPWFVWQYIHDPALRHSVNQREVSRLKWYIVWAVASGLIGKIFSKKKPVEKYSRKRVTIEHCKDCGSKGCENCGGTGWTRTEEIDDGTQQEDIRQGEPKDRRKDHRRVQRG